MTTYKNLIEAAKAYMDSVPLLRFLLMASVYIFGGGAALYIIGIFMPLVTFGAYEPLAAIGRILMFAGLILTIIKEEELILLIISASISIISLIAWIVLLAMSGGFGFLLEPLLYFLGFGAIAGFTLMKSEKFKQMRAESAARAQVRAQQQAELQAQAAAQQAAAQQAAAQQAPPAPEATAGKTCAQCGASLPSDAGFCGQCGAKQ